MPIIRKASLPRRRRWTGVIAAAVTRIVTPGSGRRIRARQAAIGVTAVPVLTAALGAAAVPFAAAGTAAPAAPRWRVIKVITNADTALEDIVGFRQGTIWTGGTSFLVPVIYHRTIRGAWPGVMLPGPNGAFVTNVSASSPPNVWATIANAPFVVHLTPTGRSTKSFANGTDQVVFGGVVTTGPRNTWVLVYDFTIRHFFAERFNGVNWTRSPLPALVSSIGVTHEVSASGPDNIWACAFVPKTSSTVTMHFNGHAWKIVRLPGRLVPKGQAFGLLQILATSPTDVWSTADNLSTGRSVILLHWNGRTWRRIGGKLPAGELAGPLASDGHGGVWVIGRRQVNHREVFSILHYSRGRWTRASMPSDPLGQVVISALQLIPGTESVLGAGVLVAGGSTLKGGVVIKFG